VWLHHNDRALTYDVAVTPLYDRPSGSATGASISFEDVTRYRVLEAELEQSTQELQTAYEELRSTNEELQATNDEFHVVNEMLDARGQELDHANIYLQSVLTSIRSGVVVVDPDFVVQIWNHWSEDLWGLRAAEVEGKHLVNLDIGLEVTDVLPSVRGALDGDEDVAPQELGARNRRGRDFTCVVRTSPVVAGGSVIGAVILMAEQDGHDD
jgi:two-component system CheB/CheR fusion protein